jgi:hypothetical protein
VHHTKGAHQRQRHRQSGNERGLGAAQKHKNHADHQRNGQQQFVLHISNRGADGQRAVGQHLHIQRSWQGGLQLGQQGLDAVHRFNDVGTWLALDVQDDASTLFSAISGPGGQAVVFGRVDDWWPRLSGAQDCRS